MFWRTGNSEYELVKRARRQDSAAIKSLYDKYVQYLAAVIFGGAELVQGVVTVLLQTALSIPPMALLYLPFRNHKD